MSSDVRDEIIFQRRLRRINISTGFVSPFSTLATIQNQCNSVSGQIFQAAENVLITCPVLFCVSAAHTIRYIFVSTLSHVWFLHLVFAVHELKKKLLM